MLEAGMHFGHKSFRWHPNMAPFIFGEREGVHIIDLVRTQECLKRALDFINQLVSKGGVILFVGTKKQLALTIQQAAEDALMPYVVSRWPGGMLTNFRTVLRSLRRLSRLEEMLRNPYATKKEKRSWQKKKKLLEADFAGFINLTELPNALFVADLIKEKTAVAEARKLGIPIIGIVDTNANPVLVDYPIPANDDATSSVALIAQTISRAVQTVRKKAKAEAAPVSSEEKEDAFVEDELLEQPEAMKAEGAGGDRGETEKAKRIKSKER